MDLSPNLLLHLVPWCLSLPHMIYCHSISFFSCITTFHPSILSPSCVYSLILMIDEGKWDKQRRKWWHANKFRSGILPRLLLLWRYSYFIIPMNPQRKLLITITLNGSSSSCCCLPEQKEQVGRYPVYEFNQRSLYRRWSFHQRYFMGDRWVRPSIK